MLTPQAAEKFRGAVGALRHHGAGVYQQKQRIAMRHGRGGEPRLAGWGRNGAWGVEDRTSGAMAGVSCHLVRAKVLGRVLPLGLLLPWSWRHKLPCRHHTWLA
jgi:hypothetical protein